MYCHIGWNLMHGLLGSILWTGLKIRYIGPSSRRQTSTTLGPLVPLFSLNNWSLIGTSVVAATGEAFRPYKICLTQPILCFVLLYNFFAPLIAAPLEVDNMFVKIWLSSHLYLQIIHTVLWIIKWDFSIFLTSLTSDDIREHFVNPLQMFLSDLW